MKNHSLFVRLQYLYRKISIVIVRIRMRSYHPFTESNNTFNITPLLHQQIKTLLTPNSNEGNELLTNVHDSIINTTKVDNNQDSEIGSDFTEYLKQKKSYSINHPFIGDKLKTSAWEHIHCTIRYARQGNVAMAKLHADIAGHAIEELAHFLKDVEYSELVFEVEECFDKSKIEIGPGG